MGEAALRCVSLRVASGRSQPAALRPTGVRPAAAVSSLPPDTHNVRYVFTGLPQTPNSKRPPLPGPIPTRRNNGCRAQHLRSRGRARLKSEGEGGFVRVEGRVRTLYRDES